MDFRREPGYRPEPCATLRAQRMCNAPAGNQAHQPEIFIMHHTRLALALGLVFASSAHAETVPEYVGDTIVVTPTRTPEKAGAVISDVSVITAKDIAAAGQTTLVELLQAQPGVEIKQSGGPGSQTSVSIRGGNSGHTLVLIDGLRVGSATAGTTPLENISLDQVERIEILRGPASSLYGADAVAG